MYRLNDKHHFQMDDYREKAPFSSFLPGMSGMDGIPMWVFYVNRGQGIAGFGVQDKDHAIMEFLPADKAYQLVPFQGFRTFIKWMESDKISFFEPFSSISPGQQKTEENMEISENMLALKYVNHEAGLQMTVEYFTLPHSPAAALIRRVGWKNISKKTVRAEILDGLPAVLPSGVPNAAYKELGNTLKSWFDVCNLENHVPFYRLRGSIEDTAEVKEVNHGNFYFSLLAYRGEEKRLKPIVDRDVIFGSDTGLQVPQSFMNRSVNELTAADGCTANKVACGFSAVETELAAEEEAALFTVIGHARNLETLNAFVKNHLSAPKLAAMKEQAAAMTDDITKPVRTSTGKPLFDAYTRQCYLDNGLRGGFPFVFEDQHNHQMYYLFSRKHGDLERDYNFFSLSPTYYSQGNGNYRDVNQNRRCDVFFDPKVGDYNVRLFMNLIQLDGYNPLAVKGVRFTLEAQENVDLPTFVTDIAELAKVRGFFRNSFTPGELKHFLEDEKIRLHMPFAAFLTTVILASEPNFQAEFGEGYWVDHWTYNLDLIDSYLAVFPDKKSEFFFSKTYQYFISPIRVKKRSEKYVLNNGRLRQYYALETDRKLAEEAAKTGGVLWLKDKYGKGSIYKTDLYSKLFLLALVKTATMAPYGLGIEMEAGKPGWNDSINGLPGMFGASSSELFEVKRLLALLLEVKEGRGLSLPLEAAEFLQALVSEIKKVEKGDTDELGYWHAVSGRRESYREAIYGGISGEEKYFSLKEARQMLRLLKSKVEKGIERVFSYGKVLPPTYFYFEPVQETGEAPPEIDKLDWKPVPVTPFLEGIVKALKLTKDKNEAKKIYDAVKASSIYDKKLKMYKTSMSIEKEPNELGRVKSFTPGWLENESIFLHMEYKYLLAVLKSGLADEFFADMQQAVIPFLDPAVYGRSTLENSSFIASSANPDAKLHGRGFVSRLSGSTIEFLNIWFVMMAGRQPFLLINGELACQLSPTLPSWLFDEHGKVSFTFLGSCNITYENESGKNTYGENGVSPVEYVLTYQDKATIPIHDRVIPKDHAMAIRNGEVASIHVKLA
ncbi:hypothetical protein SAMN05421736_101216 [Evansella caseinilytica]|uniref:Cellobiose phosphorylase n=1 Tax=Evansella caseinilytica TaxID=1503961 RepID=A0A1H3GN19_9BACI|nr:hypothetical protein [Evansella caseinilytica]SDY04365.1 hypothetical protein SAMN05421736_101216 [Evansella caseinilytica]